MSRYVVLARYARNWRLAGDCDDLPQAIQAARYVRDWCFGFARVVDTDTAEIVFSADTFDPHIRTVTL